MNGIITETHTYTYVKGTLVGQWKLEDDIPFNMVHWASHMPACSQETFASRPSTVRVALLTLSDLAAIPKWFHAFPLSHGDSPSFISQCA